MASPCSTSPWSRTGVARASPAPCSSCFTSVIRPASRRSCPSPTCPGSCCSVTPGTKRVRIVPGQLGDEDSYLMVRLPSPAADCVAHPPQHFHHPRQPLFSEQQGAVK